MKLIVENLIQELEQINDGKYVHTKNGIAGSLERWIKFWETNPDIFVREGYNLDYTIERAIKFLDKVRKEKYGK